MSTNIKSNYLVQCIVTIPNPLSVSMLSMNTLYLRPPRNRYTSPRSHQLIRVLCMSTRDSNSNVYVLQTLRNNYILNSYKQRNIFLENYKKSRDDRKR